MPVAFIHGIDTASILKSEWSFWLKEVSIVCTADFQPESIMRTLRGEMEWQVLPQIAEAESQHTGPQPPEESNKRKRGRLMSDEDLEDNEGNTSHEANRPMSLRRSSRRAAQTQLAESSEEYAESEESLEFQQVITLPLFRATLAMLPQ